MNLLNRLNLQHTGGIRKSMGLTAEDLLKAVEDGRCNPPLGSLPSTLACILGVGNHAKIVFAAFRPDMILKRTEENVSGPITHAFSPLFCFVSSHCDESWKACSGCKIPPLLMPSGKKKSFAQRHPPA